MRNFNLRRFGFIIFTLLMVAVSMLSTNEVHSTSIAFAALFGSIAITQEYGVPAPIVFDTILEDWVGGATIARARLAGFLQVPAGALLYISNGLAEVIKTSTVIAGGTATDIRVHKNNLWQVGEFVMLTSGGIASTITAIDRTGVDYDVITIDATLGSTPGAGEVLVEAVAVADGTTTQSAAKYTANAILKETADLERANPSASGVVRGTVRQAALPYGAFAEDVAALSLIRFA